MPIRYFLPQDCKSWVERFTLHRLKGMLPVPDFPINIQIQTQSGCNAHCRFCPNESTSGKLPKKTLPMSIASSS